VGEHDRDGESVGDIEMGGEWIGRGVGGTEHAVLYGTSGEGGAVKHVAACFEIGGAGEDIADGGGDELYAAKEAAIQISKSARIDAPSQRIELLKDIKGLLADYPEDFVESIKLKDQLIGLSDRPWGEPQGRQLTPHKLAELLKPFGIEPTQKRFN